MAEEATAACRSLAEQAGHLDALIGVIAGPDAPLYAAGGLVAPLRARLAQKAGLAILEPKGDAMTGCWLVATGKAPQERALLFGESVQPG